MIALAVLCALLGLSAGFHAGWYGKQLLETVKGLKPAEEAPEPYVSVGTAAKPFARAGNSTGSQVVTPLPPSVIKAREEEELRRLRRGA